LAPPKIDEMEEYEVEGVPVPGVFSIELLRAFTWSREPPEREAS